ncbi:MAG: 3'(2'),5'-bisphosphate nucleotidase CysQ family protein [Rhabdaerophilum sp.]
MPILDDIALSLARIARLAGRILARMQSEKPAPEFKSDASPVTAADRASEAFILDHLRREFPDIPVISEENPASHAASTASRFFLVDPLDGTRAFIEGTPDFCVSIALIEEGVPVAGVLHNPIADETTWAGDKLWRARGDVAKAELVPPVAKRNSAGPKIGIASKLHNNPETDQCLADLGAVSVIRMSSALKFVALVSGEADLYPRRTRTMQWDIAAGDAILRARGGGILDDQGQLMRYGFGEIGWESPPFLALRERP